MFALFVSKCLQWLLGVVDGVRAMEQQTHVKPANRCQSVQNWPINVLIAQKNPTIMAISRLV